jgi:hypothetical protein
VDDKIQLALELSEELLSGIEMETLSTSSAALRCLRLARLISDKHSVQWLQYETSGYTTTKDGYIEGEAFKIGFKSGRGYYSDDDKKPKIFTELASELESLIHAREAAIGALTTQGASVSGEFAYTAMNNLSLSVQNHTNNMLKSIKQSQRRISILKGKYYDYALAVNMELKFSQKVEEIFHSYRTSIDTRFIELAPDSIKMLDAAYERLSSQNSESWSQALTSCRRVFQEISEALFNSKFPNYKEKTYMTKSNKNLNISGDNYLNKLYAVIDATQTSSANNTLIGSHIIYVVDWAENLHNLLCKGVHSELSINEARRGILHTYMCLGDISNLVFNQ